MSYDYNTACIRSYIAKPITPYKVPACVNKQRVAINRSYSLD